MKRSLVLFGMLLCILIAVGACGSQDLKPVGRMTVISSEMSIDAEGLAQMWNPVPEPTSAALLGGLFGFALLLRRRN